MEILQHLLHSNQLFLPQVALCPLDVPSGTWRIYRSAHTLSSVVSVRGCGV